MVRMLGAGGAPVKPESDAPLAERLRETAAPSAEEVRELVEGPRRPIRWMRWLAALTLIVAGAAIAAYVVSNDDAETVQYQTPTSTDATQGSLTMSVYLPETSGEVYNYNPTLMVYDVAPEAGGPTMSVYLPETSGEVYNYNPTD